MRVSLLARLAASSSAVVLVVALGAGPASPAQGQTATPPPAFPLCFGAAARDILHPCNNSSLRMAVRPTPDEAVIEPNSACVPVAMRVQPFVCSFGFAATPDVPATATMALVGDSHAAHWRSALETVDQDRRWAGLSVTRSSCPFSTSTPVLAEPSRSQCLRWNPQVQRWFRRHREVSVVFISEHIQGGVRARRGTSQFEAKVAGYVAQWKALPATVTSIVVIRDTPRATGNTADCVSRAIRARRRAGTACAIPRGYAVQKDPALEAVRRLNSRRYLAIDLTSFFCTRRLCPPVIGGALVHKDPGHITRVYGQTLGPYLLRAVEKLPPFAPAAAPAPAPAPVPPPAS